MGPGLRPSFAFLFTFIDFGFDITYFIKGNYGEGGLLRFSSIRNMINENILLGYKVSHWNKTVDEQVINGSASIGV